MTKQEWICKNEDETAHIAADIAAMIAFPATVCLYGGLGAGKTSLCRALIRIFLQNPDEIVPSPTYGIVQIYDHAKPNIWHFDLYRLDHPEDIYDLGWEEALAADLCLIEWPEHLGALKPKKTVDITIDVLPDENRHIILTE